RKYKKYQLSLLFANQFSTFLSSGLSIKQILDHLSVQEKLPILAHYATIILEELNKGVKISMTLEQLPLLDEQLVDAFSKESESFIAHALNGYVIYITDKLYDDVMKWIQIIQPLFFTVIACFVIVSYLILLYPMLQFIESLEGGRQLKSLKGQKGFTLIEMLIVMLVITILLLLIIPNITKQSSSLREKGCDALIKTVQTQVEAYQLDHAEKPSSLNTLLSEGYINDDQLTCEGGIAIVYSDETGEVSKGS